MRYTIVNGTDVTIQTNRNDGGPVDGKPDQDISERVEQLFETFGATEPITEYETELFNKYKDAGERITINGDGITLQSPGDHGEGLNELPPHNQSQTRQ